MDIIRLLKSFNHSAGNHFEQFNDLARLLINNYVIRKGNSQYQIHEIEFYYYGNDHLDSFAHCSPAQKKVGRWYFHGSGADITFGNDTAFGGILLRGVVKKGDPKIINGPYKVFDELFLDNETVDGKEIAKVVIEPVRVPDKLNIVHGPRSGIRLLASELDKEDKQKYLFKPYRFIALDDYPQFSEKYLIGLYLAKILNQDIRFVTNKLLIDHPSFVINCNHFDEGKTMDFGQVATLKQSVEKACMLFGNLSERYVYI
jgi:hypothetical protein